MSQDPDPSAAFPTDDELRELIKNATDCYRTTDYTGVIRFQDGLTLCYGGDYDVTWSSAADQEFVTRITPRVVQVLMLERDAARKRSQQLAELVKSLGGNPADIYPEEP